MLPILFTILKVLGIILLVILALLLLMLILALFVPVCYCVKAQKEQEDIVARGKVHWLLHIVSFHVDYEGGEPKMKVMVFGVPVWRG